MSQFADLFVDKELGKPPTMSAPKKAMRTPPSRTKAVLKPAEKPKGKSADKETYTQVLTYIRKDTHNAVKAALIYDLEKRDLSDLVEELLADWVQAQGK